MRNVRPNVVISLLAIVGLMALGFWLGAFAWFGGYRSVQEAVGWAALGIGSAVVAFRWWAFPQRWPWHICYFVASQLLFLLGIALGQVYYVGPNNLADAINILGTALQGGL